MVRPKDRLPPGTMMDKSVPMSFEDYQRRNRRKVVRVVVPVIAVMVLIGVAAWRLTRADTSRKFFVDAQTNFQAGRYLQAISDLDQVLAQQPGHENAYRLRYRALANTGQTDAALRDLQILIRIRPDDPELFRSRADLLASKHACADALTDYDRAIRMRAGPEAYAGRAVCLRELGRAREALPDFRRAIELKPDVNYFMELGQTYYALGEYAQAVQAFTDAIGAHPYLPFPYRSRAMVFEKLGDTAKAVADRKKADSLE